MHKFFIQSLIILGNNKRDSILEFSNGLNIIYGPSNTGKTYILKCIDFVFGSKNKFPISIDTGYSKIKLILQTENGEIILEREIGKNIINVSSQNKNIPSKAYNLKEIGILYY